MIAGAARRRPVASIAPRAARWREHSAHAGLETPELDARVLVGHALGLDHAGAGGGRPTHDSPTDEADAIAALARRAGSRGEPVARIVGAQGILGPAAAVTPTRWCRGRKPKPWSRLALARSIARRARARAAHRRSRHRLGRDPAGAAVASCRTRAASAPTSARDALDVARAQCRAARPCRSRARSSLATIGAALAGAVRSRRVEPALYRERATSRRSRPRCATTIRALRSTAAPTALRPIGRSPPMPARLLAPDGHLVVEIGAGQADAVDGTFAPTAGLQSTAARHDLAGHRRGRSAGAPAP